MQLVVIRFTPSAPINLPKPAAAIKLNKGKKTKTRYIYIFVCSNFLYLTFKYSTDVIRMYFFMEIRIRTRRESQQIYSLRH